LETLLERVKDAPETDIVRKSTTERLAAITEALEDDDYEDKTLLQKCKIPAKSRVTSTKSRQAVVARPPKSLVVHFNRSLFDEMTGELKKNYADVRFPKILDLGPWCLGSSGTPGDALVEEWLLKPNKSMIATGMRPSRVRGPLYELRAVVTHYGRHENGHYICYRKHPVPDPDEKGSVKDQWWRLSDDDVMKVSEENVMDQGGVFMLFFDNIEPGRLWQTENTSAESTVVRELVSQSELELATSIPLPDSDDSDISEADDGESSLANYGESTATSVSEGGNDNEDYEPAEDKPAQTIVVPSGIQKTGVHSRGGGTRQTGTTFPTNMLIV
jgi:ubiquitin carboxyl-terminal hydrolase 1